MEHATRFDATQRRQLHKMLPQGCADKKSMNCRDCTSNYDISTSSLIEHDEVALDRR